MNRGDKLAVRCRYVLLVAFICGSGFIMSLLCRSADIIVFTAAPTTAWDLQQHYPNNIDERFTIQTNGCNIPLLRPLDESIKKFFEYPYPLKPKPCRDSSRALLIHSDNRISINMSNLHYYNITDANKLFCCYRAFYRPLYVTDITSFFIDNRVEYGECYYFTESILVNDEFAKVNCFYNESTKVYENFYLSALKKDFLYHDGRGEITHNKRLYNVLIIGIDAVSRLNFYRKMPKTVSFLKDNGGVDLVGFNKVGDNTFPNVIPVLLGIPDTELNHTCVPYEGITFDNCPFIWEQFKRAGYYTALAEDSSLLGTFNYFRPGFSRTPTDYYIHTFIQEAEIYSGYNLDFNCFLCMNDKYFYKVLLDYIEGLTVTLENHKLFGFFWEVTMSHDYLNYPVVMDDSYLKFFEKLQASNYLSETIVFLMSDHGMRWGNIRFTKQGRLEERLPLMFILPPLSFREKYSNAYNNLKLNSKRLTTPFDIHETLLDLINLKNITNDAITTRTSKYYANKRGISLFLPIPTNRTCKMAGIDDHWCTCHKGTLLSNVSSEAFQVSTQLVRHLNMLLKDHPECAKLALAEIMEISEMEVGEPDDSETGWREFMVMVRTTPGDGVFEATLRVQEHDWSLAGSASRLNLYGDQSRCVHNYQLKLYCYCIYR